MSNEFSTYKIYAQLALDAYEDHKINDVVNFNDNDKYTVLNQRNFGGFSATLYENKNGEKILAIRGTNVNDIGAVDDLINDLLLGTIGKNWQESDLQKFYDDMVKTGILSPNEKIVVTGHSLGGYLAQLFTIANEDKISHTYTYNAPGLLGLTGTLLNLFGTSNIKSNKITDILAKDSINFTNAMGLNAGEEVKVSGDSHFIIDLTQILYFYDMAISNGASENVVTNYLSGFYNTPNSLFSGSVASIAQSTISQIEQIVGKANGANDIIEICNAYENNNVKFNLDLISPNSNVTSFFSGSNLSTPALYALVNLNPFIVSGVDSSAYSELEKFKDEYSGNYVSDKAKMLEALLGKSNSSAYYSDLQTGKIYHSETIVDDATTDEYIVANKGFFFGTNSNDIITGKLGENFIDTRKENFIYTLAGDDRITLSSGSNYIEAGSGSDYIDLSGIKDTNSTNTIYADLKDSKDDKDSGNDIIIGSAGKDTMYGGSGNDKYYAGNGDTIEDDDKGEGSVYFNSNSPLTGGTYDKDKACYVGGIYEYHLNGNTLIVTDTAKNESITINNYSKKDKSLGIDLIEADEIDIIISNATVTEGDESEPNKDGKAPYNTSIGIKLSRELKEDEFIIIQKYNYEKQSTELVLFGTLPQDYDTSLFKSLLSDNKTLDFSWYGNKTKEEDRKYCVGGVNIFAKSDNLTIRDIKPGYVTIKDDDKDPNDDKPETYDPLAIDLNNDGIKGTNLDYKINFDLDNNGFKEATSWIDNNDAFIAIDKNNNGAIDNGSELFGNKSISNNAYAYTNPNAKNGFEALSEFDSNNDGIIDEKDKEFTNLLLWQDKNSNGISETDELIKLSDKVKSINLNYTKNGNTEISSATLQDGSSVKVQDMYFNVDLKKTEEIIDENQIPFEIKSLPNVKAFGNLKEFANLNLLVA